MELELDLVPGSADACLAGWGFWKAWAYNLGLAFLG